MQGRIAASKWPTPDLAKTAVTILLERGAVLVRAGACSPCRDGLAVSARLGLHGVRASETSARMSFRLGRGNSCVATLQVRDARLEQCCDGVSRRRTRLHLIPRYDNFDESRSAQEHRRALSVWSWQCEEQTCIAVSCITFKKNSQLHIRPCAS